MSTDTRNLLFALVLSCLCFLLWIVTTIAVYVDVRRRSLSGTEQMAWVALAAVFPGLGFGAYLFARLVAAFFSPSSTHTGAEGGKKRVTFLQRINEPEVRTGTIPAADLIRPTVPDADEHLTPIDTAPKPITLTVLAGPHIGENFVLNALPAPIGREPGATIQLAQDPRVSRLHAEIYRKDGALRIRDLRSTHGTHVNGFSIDDKALEPGDQIEVGISVLLLNP